MRRPSGSFRPSYVGFGAPVASRRTCFGAYSDRREHLFCRAAARSLRLGAGGPSPPGRTGNAYERNRLRLRNAIAERRTSRRRRPGVFRTVRASVFRTPHRTFPARSLRRYASARARERIRFTARTAAAETDSERSAAGRTETARSGCPKIPYHDVSQRSPVLLPTAVVYHSDPCRPGACFCMSPPPVARCRIRSLRSAPLLGKPAGTAPEHADGDRAPNAAGGRNQCGVFSGAVHPHPACFGIPRAIHRRQPARPVFRAEHRPSRAAANRRHRRRCPPLSKKTGRRSDRSTADAAYAPAVSEQPRMRPRPAFLRAACPPVRRGRMRPRPKCRIAGPHPGVRRRRLIPPFPSCRVCRRAGSGRACGRRTARPARPGRPDVRPRPRAALRPAARRRP